MKTWLKGGIVGSLIYFLVQFIDDFFYVFFNITPLETLRYILYLDFFNQYDYIVLKCYDLFELCGVIYILILGFVVGSIIGAAMKGFSERKKRRRKKK